MKTEPFASLALAAGLAFVGCGPARDVVVDPPAPESQEVAIEPTTNPAEEIPAAQDVPLDDRGLEEEAANPLPAGASPPLDPALLESLPTIADLPALSDETTIDEQTQLPFAKVGGFEVRDGVYYLRMNSGEGMRELIMTVETQANGFVVRRGDRTRLRFVVDGDRTTFASEPGGGEIAGRGSASGDDWVQGAFRTKNADGTTTDGTFELRKLSDPKTPRTEKAAPAPTTEENAAEEAAPEPAPATADAAPTEAVPEG